MFLPTTPPLPQHTNLDPISHSYILRKYIREISSAKGILGLVCVCVGGGGGGGGGRGRGGGGGGETYFYC